MEIKATSMLKVLSYILSFLDGVAHNIIVSSTYCRIDSPPSTIVVLPRNLFVNFCTLKSGQPTYLPKC
jgi:hypothetical protein